jgi:hypothetical protein
VGSAKVLSQKNLFAASGVTCPPDLVKQSLGNWKPIADVENVAHCTGFQGRTALHC